MLLKNNASLRRAALRPAQQFYQTPERTFFTSKEGYICFAGSVFFVREKYACLVHRFSKFQRLVKPGINFKIPFVETIEFSHDLREKCVEISSQVAVTRDNVALHIDGVLYLQITDPEKASYGVENIEEAISNLAQTTMRSEIGKLTLDKTFEERETLNKNIVDAIDKEIQDWGTRCIRYEIKDIEPPKPIQKHMILQAEAERQKRAHILESEGEQQSRINIAEAKKISQELRAEGQAQAAIAKATASATALKQIAEALGQQGGQDSANFILGEKYIDAYGKVANEKNTIILDSEPIKPGQKVEEAFNILEKVNLDQKMKTPK